MSVGLCAAILCACGPASPGEMDSGTASSGDNATASGTGSTGNDVTTGVDPTTGSSGSSGEPETDPNCPELVYEGVLILESLDQVQSLPRYTEITEGLALVEVAGLLDLTNFSCLRSTPILNLFRNPDLRSAIGLERLEHIRGLLIYDNPVLDNLDGLENLRSVSGKLTIRGNPALETIGLRSLEEVTLLDIGRLGQDGPGYVDEQGIPAFDCGPDGNPGLTEIDGLDSLQRFCLLRILGNQNLTSIDALQPIAARAQLAQGDDDLDVCGDRPRVEIWENPNLSPAHIEMVWSSVGPDGAELYACGNEGEETCVCYPGP